MIFEWIVLFLFVSLAILDYVFKNVTKNTTKEIITATQVLASVVIIVCVIIHGSYGIWHIIQAICAVWMLFVYVRQMNNIPVQIKE